MIFIFGLMGNILNCFVLSQQTLKSNPCAILFRVSSCVDIISIVIGLLPRILSGWDLDPTAKISSLCKIRAFIVFSTRTMAIWFIAMASVDRWLLSSIILRRRLMSTLKNVQYSMIIIFILSIISFVHMFYCYEANLIDTPLECYGKSHECRLMTDMIYVFLTILLPLTLMLIFGVMTISNVHHSHNQVRSSLSKDSKFKRIDHHLFRMLLIQIFLLFVLCIPQAILKFHITFKPFHLESNSEDVVRHFLYQITLLLAFIASGMPFYIYTLAGGKVFRKAFLDFIRHFLFRLHR